MAARAEPEGRRVFIAVPLPPAMRAAVAALQRSLRPRLSGVRWSRPETAHLTLVFLGTVAEESLETIAAVMLSVSAAAAPFSLAVAGLGLFPSPVRPRVLWVGLADPSGVLARLQTDLRRGLATRGVPLEERPFRPHLTLGRFGPPQHPVPELPAALRDVDLGTLAVSHLVLFESRLHPAGAEHIPLQTAVLGATGGATGPAAP